MARAKAQASRPKHTAKPPPTDDNKPTPTKKVANLSRKRASLAVKRATAKTAKRRKVDVDSDDNKIMSDAIVKLPCPPKSV